MAPPLETHRLAGGSVTFRSWPKGRACEAEPRFLLDELTAVNSGLDRYLDRTAGDAPADWSERRITEARSLDDGLDKVLELHAQNLEGVARCGFATEAGFPFVRERGLELVKKVRDRKGRLEKLFAEARLERARQEWTRSLPSQRADARSRCPQRSGEPVVYFAWLDEEGTHWSFCDGAQLVRTGNAAEPLLDPPSSVPRGQKKFGKKDYLDVAARFPEARVAAPPTTPTF